MNQGAMLAGALVLGAVGGAVAGSLAGSSSPAAGRAPADGPAAAAVSSEAIERLERRVEELAAAAARDPAKAAAPASAEGASAAPAAGGSDAAPAPEDKLAALEARVAALEKRGAGGGGSPLPADLSKLSHGELEALSREMMQQRRHGDLLRVAEEMAKRTDLTPEQRIDAEMNIGYGLRGLGKHAEAEARFRETLARTDASSDKAAWLGFQIAWERSYQKDPAGGSLEMEKAANHPAVTPIVRVHALYGAANMAKEAGDTARARVFYERLLQQHGDDIPASQPFIRTGAEQALKQLSGN